MKLIIFVPGLLILALGGFIAGFQNNVFFAGPISNTISCTPAFTINSGSSGTSPFTFQLSINVPESCFTATATNPVEFDFNWGDNSAPTIADVYGPNANCGTSWCSPTEAHVYTCTSPGTYTFTGSVVDDFGDFNVNTATVRLTSCNGGGGGGSSTTITTTVTHTISDTITITRTRTITTTISGTKTTITKTDTITASPTTTTRTVKTIITLPGTTILSTRTDTTTFYRTNSVTTTATLTKTTTINGQATTITTTVTGALTTYTITTTANGQVTTITSTDTVNGPPPIIQLPADTGIGVMLFGIILSAIGAALRGGRTPR